MLYSRHFCQVTPRWRPIVQSSWNFHHTCLSIILWCCEVILIIFNSPRLFRIFLSFNMEGDLLKPSPSTFDQPLTIAHQPFTVENWLTHRWKRIIKPFNKIYLWWSIIAPIFHTPHIYSTGAVLVCRIKIVKKILVFLCSFFLYCITLYHRLKVYIIG